MTKDEALKMAIDCLECHQVDVLNVCKEALEQPAWQGLSDDEIIECNRKAIDITAWGLDRLIFDFARIIEQELKEKNNAM